MPDAGAPPINPAQQMLIDLVSALAILSDKMRELDLQLEKTASILRSEKRAGKVMIEILGAIDAKLETFDLAIELMGKNMTLAEQKAKDVRLSMVDFVRCYIAAAEEIDAAEEEDDEDEEEGEGEDP